MKFIVVNSYSGTKMNVAQTCQCPGPNIFQKQQGKGIECREIADQIVVGGSSVCEKATSAGSDGNLFRPVPVPRKLPT